MSRTYRRGVDWFYVVHGERIPMGPPYIYTRWDLGWKLDCRYHNKCRDGKHHNGLMCSPPTPWAKRLQARWERRQQNWAVRDGKDVPVFKKTVRWDWW